jgi:hypothetical protein
MLAARAIQTAAGRPASNRPRATPEITMKHLLPALLLVLAGPASAESIDKVNGSIRVDAGQQVDDVSTVNGSIRLGRDARAKEVETVNGSVYLDTNASAQSVDNVNGSIAIEEGAKVAKDVDSVNGSISLEKGADVAGKVSNVNGRISLDAAHVGGGIETTTGDIEVGAKSRVENGILVSKSRSWGVRFGKEPVPRIVIGPGAVVQGAMRFEREVKLYVSNTATVGTIEGATPVKFAGDHPPE